MTMTCIIECLRWVNSGAVVTDDADQRVLERVIVLAQLAQMSMFFVCQASLYGPEVTRD